MKQWREMTEAERSAVLKPLCERGLTYGEIAAETGAPEGSIAYFLSVTNRDLMILRRERNAMRETAPAVKAAPAPAPAVAAPVDRAQPKPSTAPALVMLNRLIEKVDALDAKVDAIVARQAPDASDLRAVVTAIGFAFDKLAERIDAGQTALFDQIELKAREIIDGIPAGSHRGGDVTEGPEGNHSPLRASPKPTAVASAVGTDPQSPSNRDASAGGKASSTAAPQGEAVHTGIGSETPADREEQHESRHLGEEGSGPSGVTAGETALVSPLGAPEAARKRPDLSVSRRAPDTGPGKPQREPRIAAGDEKAAMLAAAIMAEHENTSKGDDHAEREHVDGDRGGRSRRDHGSTRAAGAGAGPGRGAEAEARPSPQGEDASPALQIEVESAQPDPADASGLRGAAVGGGEAVPEERKARHLGRAVLPDLSRVCEAAVEPERSPFRRGRPAQWADENIDLVRRLAADGKTDQQIADALGGGITKRAVCSLRRRHRIETNSIGRARHEYDRPKWPPERVEELRLLAAEGKTDDEIIAAMDLKVRRGAVIEVRKRHGIESGVAHVRRHGPSTQISDELGEKVLEFWSAGATGKDTEERFGLGRGQLKAFLLKARQAGDPRAKARVVRGPAAKSKEWPPERMAEVERLVREEGKSDIEIAGIMGATKGMIVGIRNRARIPSATTLRREAEASTPKIAAPTPAAPVVRLPVKPAAVAPKTKPPAPIKVAQRYGDIDRDALGLPIIAPAHEQEVLDSGPEPSFAPGEQVTIMMLTAKTCRWPSGHPGNADFTFCGKRSETGRPYCAAHVRIAYQPLPGKRKTGVAA